jgi:hypothetical protein
VSFSQIDWAGHTCPSCHASKELSSGVNSEWCYCNNCKRIFCAGKIKNTSTGDTTPCPWCWRITKITIVVEPGDSTDLPVSDEAGSKKKNRPAVPALPRQKKQLPGGPDNLS